VSLPRTAASEMPNFSYKIIDTEYGHIIHHVPLDTIVELVEDVALLPSESTQADA
jgi:hypothetical protein